MAKRREHFGQDWEHAEEHVGFGSDFDDEDPQSSAEDRRALGMLQEMANDLRDFAAITQMTSSIRATLDQHGGAVPGSAAMPQAGEVSGPLGTSGPLATVPEVSQAAEETAEEAAEDAAEEAAEEAWAALRAASLLRCPFEAALRRCAALRRHVERARREEEEEGEVEAEFREHWHPGAPPELRAVLQQLLLEHISSWRPSQMQMGMQQFDMLRSRL